MKTKEFNAAAVREWAREYAQDCERSCDTRHHRKTAEFLATAVRWYEEMKSAGITTVDRETVLENERLRAAFEELYGQDRETWESQAKHELCDALRGGK
jgi:hypothetical protein